MAKEENGGKFPPLLIHSEMRIKREKGKLKRNESGSKQKNSGGKEKKKGKQTESHVRERERKKRVSTFSLRSTGIELSVSVEARGKVGPRNESYARVPKSGSFVKL